MEIIKKQNYATKISTILFLLIPFLYFTGPFLSDLTIVVIILLFLLKFKNNYIKKNKNLIILTLIFSVYLFLNHILLNEFDKNYLKSLFYFRFFLILPAALLIFNNLHLTRIFMYSILAASIFIIFDIFFQKIFGFDLFGISAIESYNKGMHFVEGVKNLSDVKRFSGVFGDELIGGGYISRFFLINLIFLNYEIENLNINISNKMRPIIIPTFSFLVFLAILLSGERSALIFSLISYFLYLLFFSQNLKKFLSGLIIFFTVIFLIFSFANFKDRFYHSSIDELFNDSKPIPNLQDTDYKIKLKYISKNKHLSHYLSAIEIFKQEVFFGSGFKNYRNKCNSNKFECSTHPHNVFLELLSSIGILGSLIFYSFFLVYFNSYIRSDKNLRKNYLYFSFIILSFLFIIPTGSIFNNYYSILSFFSLSGITVLLKNLNIERKL